MAGKGKFKKNGMVIAHDEKHTGPEPTWDDAEFLSDEGLQDRMLDALRFYGYYLDRDDFSNFAMAWMVDAGYTPEDIKVIRSMPKEFSLSTSGKLCRMFSLGMPTSFNGKDHEEYVKNNVEMALERTRIHIAHKKLEEKVEEEANEPKPVPPMKRPFVTYMFRVRSKNMSHLPIMPLFNFLVKFDYFVFFWKINFVS